jgi:hypothetical protein
MYERTTNPSKGKRMIHWFTLRVLAAAMALMASATLTSASRAEESGFAGKLISSEPMPGAPDGARAYRISVAGAAVAWMAGRFAGKPAPTNCGT